MIATLLVAAGYGRSLRGGAGHSVMRSGTTSRSGKEKTLALARSASVSNLLSGGRYWNRTSDLLGVNEAL